MPVPVAQAGVDQSFAFTALPQLVTLSGNGTNPPHTSFEWTMLSVPSTSTANVGTNNDFVNGVSTLQNPSFTCDVQGAYVLQLRVENASGFSDPDSDQESAQTIAKIRTEHFDMEVPGFLQYRYDDELNAAILTLETNLATHAARHQNNGDDEINVAGLSGLLADPQTPAAHSLGGSEHNSDTLANLNAKISDATLDDSSAARTPTTHGLGGSEHSSATLAQLNAKVSDATLDDSSASRPPSGAAGGQLGDTYPNPTVRGLRESGGTQLTMGAVADGQILSRSGSTIVGAAPGVGTHALGGSEHTADTLANLNAKVSDATLIDTNDSRLSDARTPTSHAASHQSGGGDAIKLDDLAAPDDNTDLNVSISAHGLCPKLSNNAAQYLDGTGAYSTPATGFSAREEEFTAVAGANEFTLAATPGVNANTLSGRNILGVFRNGLRSRYQATATLSNEYDQSGGNDKINVVGQAGGEIFTVVYGD